MLALASGLKPRFMPHEAAGMHRNRRKHHTTVNLSLHPSLPFLQFLLISSQIFSLYLYEVTWLPLPLSVPWRQVFWTETKERCVSLCGLQMSQVKALAEIWLRTMKVGLEPSQGRSDEQNPCQGNKVCKRLTHMLLYCTGRNFGITYLCHIWNDYT